MARAWTVIAGVGLLIVCAGAVLLYAVLRPEPVAQVKNDSDPEQKAPPRPVAITVEASFPGGSALVVSETVGEPIEQQMQNLECMRFMKSRCGNDGSYRLTITFEPGTDLDKAQQSVVERVSLAQPLLPPLVRGVTIKKESPGVLLIATLTSPGGKHDARYLSNYAKMQIQDELAALPGVSEVKLVGAHADRVHVLLDPAKMARSNVAVSEVLEALKAQTTQVAAGNIGQPPRIGQPPQIIEAAGDPKQIGDTVVQTSKDGVMIRVKDVGRVDVTSYPQSEARISGMAAAALAVLPTPEANFQELAAAVNKALDRQRARLPGGLSLNVVADFTSQLTGLRQPQEPEFLLFNPDLPDTTSPERVAHFLEVCEKLAMQVPGVTHTLLLTEDPFDPMNYRPCLLVRLAAADAGPGRVETTREIRKRFEELPEGIMRLRDLSSSARFPASYPIELALQGPDAGQVNLWARAAAQRLQEGDKLTDVGTTAQSVPQLYLDMDREALASAGISVQEAFKALQTLMGDFYVNDFNRFGRTWQVVVQMDAPTRGKREALELAKVRDRNGDLVPLAKHVKLREQTVESRERLNGEPTAQVTANPAAGVPLADARALCEKAVEEVRRELKLPAQYRLTWLGEAPSK